ncbi:Protein SSUH2 [Nymphon striatum]|nr:Protein SSUH2 [Nymphon striatum]KAG1671928.1 Protein SSUH2 [Nymphon striatum]
MADNQFLPPQPGSSPHDIISGGVPAPGQDPAQPPAPGQINGGYPQQAPSPGSFQSESYQTQPPAPGSQPGYPSGPNSMQPPAPGTQPGYPSGPNSMQPPAPGTQPGYPSGQDHMQPPAPGSQPGYPSGPNPMQPPAPGTQPGYPSGPNHMQPPAPGSQPGYPSGPNHMQPPAPGSQPGYPSGQNHMQSPPPGSQPGYSSGPNPMQPPAPGRQPGYPPGPNHMQLSPPGSISPGSNRIQPRPQGGPRNQQSTAGMLSSEDPVPSAPALQTMDKFQGYENVSFNGVAAPPPAYHEAAETQSHERGEISNLPKITEDQVREALIHHVSESCCYGSSAATEMVFNSLETTSAFHYKLESFTERRETCWAYKPYTDIKMLDEKVLPWITKSFGERYIFNPQCSIPHIEFDQKWCKNPFSGFWDKNMWPSSSPDISPMDFAIWSVLKSGILAKSYSSFAALKETLLASWATFYEQEVRILCHSVTSRLEVMAKAKEGQVIDSAHNGRPPLPWDIQVIAPKSFVMGKCDVEIPHTASVKKCHGCHGHGYKRCSTCHGHGHSKCFSCSGKGHVYSNSIESEQEHRCIACDGSGERKCNRCNGHGDICCHICESTGELKCFLSMTVTWSVHLDDHVVERTALPDRLIKTVSGQVALEEEQPRVWPVNHFPDSSINKASSDLVTKHVNNYPAERILMQRQQIRIIPVIQAFYKWNNKEGEFYVFGFEQNVYAPDYPQK